MRATTTSEALTTLQASLPIFRCPLCRARLFDGWLIGIVRCWRCKHETQIDHLDKFAAILQNGRTTH